MDIGQIKTSGYRPAIEFIFKTFGSYLNPDKSDDGELTDVIYGQYFNKLFVQFVGFISLESFVNERKSKLESTPY